MASDPLNSLASSIHAGPGTFALLLGSGISANSGVPTGWDVSLELVRRLAALRGEDVEDDPIAWYRGHADGDPDYPALLAELAPSPVDRRNLLQPHFEPTEDERAEGTKLPTRAHKAIAELVAGGFVKVIVTTNFDRLLEAALVEAGVQPNVVSSPAQAEGALPIAHSRCTVIKVHGDYLSPDLKNTIDELAGYDPEIDRLLDEVFDQYGLVVCGWSGVWDAALRKAILRSPNRRFATYWFHRGAPASEAQQILNHRAAIAVPIQDTDTAFESLAARVQALVDAIDQRPQDTAFAVAQLKRYLPDPVHRIKLHDLVATEVDTALERVRDLRNLPVDIRIEGDQYAHRISTYEEATATLLKLLATGAFYSDGDDHDRLWTKCVERLAAQRMQRSGLTVLLDMQQYPTLLTLYAIALGSVSADRLEPIACALGSIAIQESDELLPVAVSANSWRVLDHDLVQQSISGLANHKTPISEHLLDVLRPAVSEIIREEDRLEDLFDEVEYLMGLACTHHDRYGRGPVGRAAWRSRITDRLPGALIDRHKEMLVREGVFKGAEQLAETREAYNNMIRQSGWL